VRVEQKSAQRHDGVADAWHREGGARFRMGEWLPFLHPLWQGVGLALGFAALREGLALRRRRRQRRLSLARGTRQARHVRLGKACWWMLSSGYFLGIAELSWVRGEPVMGSAHFYFATLALALLCWGALYGLAMQRGTAHYAARRDVHGFLLPLALLIMVVVALLGLPLLP
jgi:hypothetical protein